MSKHTMAIARAVGVIGATVAVVTGLTFAIGLTAQPATLTATTINSASADLQVWDGSTFTNTGAGFTITNLIPGTPSADQPFYFKNNGGVDLDVTVQASTPATVSGFSGWENLKVHIVNDKAPGLFIDTNMQDLMAGGVVLPGNPLTAGAQGNSSVLATEGNYHMTFDIDPASISGSQVTVGEFNLTFTGTQHIVPVPTP